MSLPLIFVNNGVVVINESAVTLPSTSTLSLMGNVFVVDERFFSVVSPVTLNSSLILTSFENVTGPSNCERTSPDAPPSTTNLSFIVTSSNTTLNREGSSPVTVGIGTSNDTSSPVAEDFFWFPMKKSPLLFIPV